MDVKWRVGLPFRLSSSMRGYGNELAVKSNETEDDDAPLR